MKKLIILAFPFLLLLNFTFVQAQEQMEDVRTKDLTEYKKIEELVGAIESRGNARELNNMMTFWVEGFCKIYPNVKISIEGIGCTSAVSALTHGISPLVSMSRVMKKVEIDEFEKAHGFKPSKIAVAYDSLAVFVNKDNPINSSSLEEIDAIFSKTRKFEYPKDISLWGDIGLEGEWKKQKINILGRNVASGTYGYFKKYALNEGDFKDTIKEQAGSAAVVRAISEDKMAIGYSGIGYIKPEVKALALSHKKGDEAFEANYENIVSLKYPLSRKLYIYYVKNPDKPLGNLEKEFLKFVLSKEGQNIVIKDGYIPITKTEAEKSLKALE